MKSLEKLMRFPEAMWNVRKQKIFYMLSVE